jgi:hypothetical protein
VRWRAVRRGGTRFPAVGELGVVVAQVRALIRADGIAWTVGSDDHTVEIQTGQAEGSHYEMQGIGPRWTRTLAAALQR